MKPSTPSNKSSSIWAEFPARFFLVFLLAATTTHWLAVDLRQLVRKFLPLAAAHPWIPLVVVTVLLAATYGILARLHHRHQRVIGLLMFGVLLTHWVALESHAVAHESLHLSSQTLVVLAAMLSGWFSYWLHGLEGKQEGVHELERQRAAWTPPTPRPETPVPSELRVSGESQRAHLELERAVLPREGQSAKALILFVSLPDFEIKFAEPAAPDLAPCVHAWITKDLPANPRFNLPAQRVEARLTGDLERDLVNDELRKARPNWQQLMRAIRPHRGVEFVWLIGSPESGPCLGNCRRFLQPYLPTATITWETSTGRWVGFEDFEGLRRYLDDLLSQPDWTKWPARDVVIDVTGGFKTASIAGAAITLNRETRFQYVPTRGKTEDDFLPWIYDVRMTTALRL